MTHKYKYYLQDLGYEIEDLDSLKCYPIFKRAAYCQGITGMFRSYYQDGILPDCSRLRTLWVGCLKISFSKREDKESYYNETMDRIKTLDMTKGKVGPYFTMREKPPEFFHDYQYMSKEEKDTFVKNIFDKSD